jgi:hypothetical protein
VPSLVSLASEEVIQKNFENFKEFSKNSEEKFSKFTG